jgi:hypothetical protein
MNKQNVTKVVAIVGTPVMERVLKTLSNYAVIDQSYDGLDTVLTISNVSSEAMDAIGEQQEDNHIVNLRAYTMDRFDSVMSRILKAHESDATEEQKEFFENLKDEEGAISPVRMVSRIALSANYRESLQMSDPLTRGGKVECSINFTEADENGVVYCNINNLRKVQPKVAKTKTLSLASLLGNAEKEVVNEKAIKAADLTKDNFKDFITQEGMVLTDVVSAVKTKLNSDKATVAQIIEHLQAETAGVIEEEEVF